MAFGFGLPGSGNTMNLAGTPMPAPVMGPGLGFGGQPAGGGVTLAHLLAAIASGAAAGVANDRGAIGGAGRGFLAGQQQSQQQLDRQLALEDRAMRKQYLGMQMTSMEQEALDKKTEREAAAAQKAAVDTAISDSGMSPPDQANARAFPAAYGQSLFQKPTAPTAAIQEWTAAGKPGTLQGWLDDRSAAGFHTVGDHGFFGRGPLAGTGQGNGAPAPGAAPTDGLTDIYGLTDAQYGLPGGLTAAVARRESQGKDSATGPVTASGERAGGRMQFMPGTAAQFKIDPRNPLQSVPAAGNYLSGLIKKYGSVEHGLAAYNWGPGNVDKWIAGGADPKALPAETQAYIADIMPQVQAAAAPPQSRLVVGPGGVITNQKPIEVIPGMRNGKPGQLNTRTGQFTYDPANQDEKTLEERDMAFLLDPKNDPSTADYASRFYRQFMVPKFIPGTDVRGNAAIKPIMPAVPPGVRRPTLGVSAIAGGAPVDTGPSGPAGGAAGARATAVQPTGPGGLPGPTVGETITTGMPKGQTEDARKNLQLYQRAIQQLPIVLQNFGELTKFGNQAGGLVPQVMGGNLFTSDGYQRANNALSDIGATYLYSVSGATANVEEVGKLVATVTPTIAEKAGSLADKKARIQYMVDSIKYRAANGIAPGEPLPPDAPQPPAGFDLPTATAAPAAANPAAAPAAPKSQAEFDALPSGSLYQDPADAPGIMRQKP